MKQPDLGKRIAKLRQAKGLTQGELAERCNLKTNTMRKLMILSVPFLSIFLVLLLSGLDTNAQNEQTAKNTINEANSNFIKWFNSGQIDSIGLLYLEKPCMIPDNYREIHGRDNIKGYYHILYNTGFRFTENKSKSLIISDSIAIDRGAWKAVLNDELTGTYLTQWRLHNGKWYIENEMTNTDFIGKKLKE